MESKNGKLYIVATPIGNIKDISFRAIEVLENVDFIICEDTRVTNVLLRNYNVKKPLLVYNDHSDQVMRNKILSLLDEGKNLALVSDAGTPLISDPGYKLIQALHKNNIIVNAIPGPCSVVAALSIAGVATDRFMFMGFLPSKVNAKSSVFAEVQAIKTTLVFFESSNRLLETLEVIEDYFANRKVAIVREITKIYEEVVKGSAVQVAQYFNNHPDKLRGEIVLIIDSPTEDETMSEAEMVKQLEKLMLEMSLKDAVEIISTQHKISKKQIYKLALKVKDIL
ncbi:MAG: 16S rRNA (cytidine(1402)-2'-O)-methyltransferase [Rickettsiales bacterium]